MLCTGYPVVSCGLAASLLGWWVSWAPSPQSSARVKLPGLADRPRQTALDEALEWQVEDTVVLNRTQIPRVGTTGHWCIHKCVLRCWPLGGVGKGPEMRSSQAPARVSGEAALWGRGEHMRTSGISEPRVRFAKSQEDTTRASYL